MKYRDGKQVLLGDRILSHRQSAVIVIDFDSGNYSDNFTKDDWEPSRVGVFIRFDNGALFHFDKADYQEPEELILIKRASAD